MPDRYYGAHHQRPLRRHHFGAMGGREAIYNWIQATMSRWPNNEMIHFP